MRPVITLEDEKKLAKGYLLAEKDQIPFYQSKGYIKIKEIIGIKAGVLQQPMALIRDEDQIIQEKQEEIKDEVTVIRIE